VPMSLVTHSNIERNLQKLLNRHPNLRSFGEEVKSAKPEPSCRSLPIQH
jgi:hypothetical protein